MFFLAQPGSLVLTNGSLFFASNRSILTAYWAQFTVSYFLITWKFSRMRREDGKLRNRLEGMSTASNRFHAGFWSNYSYFETCSQGLLNYFIIDLSGLTKKKHSLLCYVLGIGTPFGRSSSIHCWTRQAVLSSRLYEASERSLKDCTLRMKTITQDKDNSMKCWCFREIF